MFKISKIINITFGISMLLIAIGAQANTSFTLSDIAKYEKIGYITSDYFPSYSQCISTRNKYNIDYATYTRSNCFSIDGQFKYFICGKGMSCDFVSSSNIAAQPVNISTNTSASTTLSTSNKQKVDLLIEGLKKSRENIDDDAKFLSQLENLEKKLDILKKKYKGKKTESLVVYLSEQVSILKNQVEADSDDSNFFCELMGTCDKKTEELKNDINSNTQTKVQTKPSEVMNTVEKVSQQNLENSLNGCYVTEYPVSDYLSVNGRKKLLGQDISSPGQCHALCEDYSKKSSSDFIGVKNLYCTNNGKYELSFPNYTDKASQSLQSMLTANEPVSNVNQLIKNTELEKNTYSNGSCILTDSLGVFMANNKWDPATTGSKSVDLGLNNTYSECLKKCDTQASNSTISTYLMCHFEQQKAKEYNKNGTTTQFGLLNDSECLPGYVVYNGNCIDKNLINQKPKLSSKYFAIEMHENLNIPGSISYYDENGVLLTKSIIEAATIIEKIDKYNIPKEDLKNLAAVLDANNIKYKPYELYGNNSNRGVDFVDIANGGKGSAYDWTKLDSNCSLKGAFACQESQEQVDMAKRLNISSSSVKTSTITKTDLNQLYREVLGRDADSQGVDFYINSGKSLTQIKSELLGSDEYKNRQITANNNSSSASTSTPTSTMSATDIRKKQINALYKEVLGRDADVQGLDFYVNSGKSATQIKAELLGSDEYRNRQTSSYTSPVSQQASTYTPPQQVVAPVAPTQPVVPSSPVRIGGGSCSETQHANGYYCDSWNFSGVGVGGSLCASGVAKNQVYGNGGLISYDCYDR